MLSRLYCIIIIILILIKKNCYSDKHSASLKYVVLINLSLKGRKGKLIKQRKSKSY